MNYWLIGVAAYLALGLFLTYQLLVAYIYVMGVKRVRDRKNLTPLMYSVSIPTLYWGLLCDWLLNVFYFSVLCLDFTHYGLVTGRMKKYKYQGGTAWQKCVSAWVEKHIDDFEDKPEGHI